MGKEIPVNMAAHAAAIGAALALAGPVSAQSDPFTVEGGAEARTWQETTAPRDTPIPLHKAYKDASGEIFVTTLEAAPYPPAQILAKVYKWTDLTRQVLDQAVDRGLQDEEARLLFVGEHAARFAQLIDQGRLPGQDAEATALFRKLGDQFGPGSNDTSFVFVRRALLGHGLYAVTRVGFDESIGAAIEKFTRRLGLKARVRRFGLGRTASRAWQGEGRLVKKLNRTVWARLNERARAVREFIDDYQTALLDYAIAKLAAAGANAALDRILDELIDDIRKRHPSDPAPRGGGGLTHTQIRELLQARPVQMAAVAAAPQIGIVSPAPIAAARASDPVMRSIGVETQFVPLDYFEPRAPASSAPSLSPEVRQAELAPEPPPMQHMMQGGKPNLVAPRITGSWDGVRGRGLFD